MYVFPAHSYRRSGFEGNSPCEHLVKYNTQSINITAYACWLFCHFWCHVLGCTCYASCCCELVPFVHLSGQAKICQVHVLLMGKQNVCGFNIAMKNSAIMKILQGAGNLFEYGTCFFLGEWAVVQALTQ